MIDSTRLLAHIPQLLRDDLLSRYREIARNFVEHRWEPAELNGGKFAEVAYSIVAGALADSFPDVATKPSNFVASCRALETIPARSDLRSDRTLRVLIPRQLIALYEIRNNRGVGHIGGDVSPNSMDANVVLSTASWVMAELIRVFHGVSTAEAQIAVDSLAEKRVPLVWIVPGAPTKRVLEPSMSAPDQTLLLLHVVQGWMRDRELFDAIEYGRMVDYRSKVLKPLHRRRLIEFDVVSGKAHLTPLGAQRAEVVLTLHAALLR